MEAEMVKNRLFLSAFAAIVAACSLTPSSSPADFIIDQHEVFIYDSFPMQIQLNLAGQLPSGCHVVKWDITRPSDEGRIDVAVFALEEDLEDCSQEPQPFRKSIGLGNFSGGEFSVWLNGELISVVDFGEPDPDASVSIDSDDPIPTEETPVDTEGWIRGAAFVDSVEILLLESYPVQVRLQVTGSLPTPCHKLAWDLGEVAEDGKINLELYSLADPDVDCIQILQAFEESVPVGSYTSGEFEVWINGELVGDFEV
jgi:inhibitor of cysteine peptidase